MKQNSKPPRRSATIQDAPNEFVIDSQSAIAEFRKYKPKSILESSDEFIRLKLEPKNYSEFLASAKEREKDLIVALDHVTDPRNLGAIVRSAAFFGVKEILAPKDRQATLTQASVSTSMGGFALCDLVTVVNLKRSLEELKEAGYWILGADMGGQSAASIKGKYEKTVLVLGSEDKGLSPTVRDRCDILVGISSAAKDRVESLNVSVAAGILLAQLAD